MMRWIRRATPARVTAVTLMAALLWMFGPCQVAHAAATWLRSEAQKRAGRAVRLTPEAMRAIRGRQRGTPPPSSLPAGSLQPWEYGVTDLGGYGEAIYGNQYISIPVVSYAGKGPAVVFNLAFNSSVASGAAKPPLSSGWTHSYNITVTVDGPTGNVTLSDWDGSAWLFSKNMDGSYTPPAGDFDTLAKNGNATYTLTRKLGRKLNFGSNNKLSTIVDLNGFTTTVAYGTNGYASTITDPGSRVLTLSYDGSNRITTITDPASRQFSLTYDGNGFLQKVTYPAPAMGQAQPYFQFTSQAGTGLM